MDAWLSLSSWCLVSVVWLFLAVSWVYLQFVIVVFPDHTHYFKYYGRISLCRKVRTLVYYHRAIARLLKRTTSMPLSKSKFVGNENLAKS